MFAVCLQHVSVRLTKRYNMGCILHILHTYISSNAAKTRPIVGKPHESLRTQCLRELMDKVSKKSEINVEARIADTSLGRDSTLVDVS